MVFSGLSSICNYDSSIKFDFVNFDLIELGFWKSNSSVFWREKEVAADVGRRQR